MKVSIHAGQRFLERVLLKKDYTLFDVSRAVKYLEIVLKDIIPSGRSVQFALPGFEKYRVVYRDGSVITIIPKKFVHKRF